MIEVELVINHGTSLRGNDHLVFANVLDSLTHKRVISHRIVASGVGRIHSSNV